MKETKGTKERFNQSIALLLCATLLFPFQVLAVEEEPVKTKSVSTEKVVPLHRRQRTKVTEADVSKDKKSKTENSTPSNEVKVVDMSGDTITLNAPDSIVKILDAEVLARQDSIRRDSTELADYGKVKIFNPNPTRAMWLSALCPGLGQIYNRRYWKLPIIIGGFVGLGYATSWNSRMLTDYTKAYRDAMDNDPNTKSYMDFYPPTVKEEDIDMAWLKRSLKSKKDYFRRNRDLCIISMVGLYLLCAVDAYVDASLAQFDITPDLSMQLKPAVIEPASTNKLPSVGVQCALKF